MHFSPSQNFTLNLEEKMSLGRAKQRSYKAPKTRINHALYKQQNNEGKVRGKK